MSLTYPRPIERNGRLTSGDRQTEPDKTILLKETPLTSLKLGLVLNSAKMKKIDNS
jgi:hypothetical protein